MAGNSGKSYGLIMMKSKSVGASKLGQAAQKSIFDNSDDDEETEPGKKKPVVVGENRVKKQVKKQWEQALEEDPSAFAYDEVYDEMAKERQEKSESNKADKDKKPKYINQLLTTAKKRQTDYEAREERKQQKELEKEADEHADKEVFVTAAYRKKMEELEVYNLEEQKKEQIEALLDVTKQRDLSGFYRHFLNDQEKATSSKTIEPEPAKNIKQEQELEEENQDSPPSSPVNDDHFRQGRSERDSSSNKISNRQKTFRQRRRSSSSSSENESPSHKEHPDQKRRRTRTTSELSSDNEFNKSSETKKKSSTTQPASSSTKTMTRIEKHRRHFTPSPPPISGNDGDQNRHRKRDERVKSPRHLRRESSSDKSPKRNRSGEKEELPKDVIVIEEKIKSEEEILEERMIKLRLLFQRRNDEDSINEYRKRYFERKSALE